MEHFYLPIYSQSFSVDVLLMFIFANLPPFLDPSLYPTPPKVGYRFGMNPVLTLTCFVLLNNKHEKLPFLQVSVLSSTYQYLFLHFVSS